MQTLRQIISIGRYKGGKVLLAKHILPYLPDARRYLEPFGGLYTLGLNYYGSPERHYTDLNVRTWNLLSQIQQNPARLIEAIRDSARDKQSLRDCWEEARHCLEDARRYYWVCYASHNGGGTRWCSGLTESKINLAMAHQARHLGKASDRLRGVNLHCLNGIQLLQAEDFNRGDVLAYVDPTYTMDSRGAKDTRSNSELSRSQYAYETDQTALLLALANYRGMAVVSGYDNPAYAEALEGWQTIDIKTRDGAKNDAAERLWINPLAWENLARQGCLFSTA
jgi:DNA adenine methylase